MIPLWSLFLISHSTSWLIRSPRPVNIKIRKLLVHYFATALTSFIRKCKFKVRGHAFTWKQPVSSLARLSSAYWLFHTRGGAAVWSTPKRVVCMVFFSCVSADIHQEGRAMDFFTREDRQFFIIRQLCTAPGWSHAEETVEESVYILHWRATQAGRRIGGRGDD